jgi:hypothetical protein
VFRRVFVRSLLDCSPRKTGRHPPQQQALSLTLRADLGEGVAFPVGVSCSQMHALGVGGWGGHPLGPRLPTDGLGLSTGRPRALEQDLSF